MQMIYQGAAAHFLDAERLRHRTDDQVWITNAGESDEDNAVRELFHYPGYDLDRQASLADAAGPDQRYQTTPGKHVTHRGELAFATDKAAERRRQDPGGG
jgi:hypothetical protein